MLSLFHSKNYKFVVSQLQEQGFYWEGMRNFKIGATVMTIKTHNVFNVFIQVINDMKLTHFTLFKAILIVLHLIQADPKIRCDPTFETFISKLESKATKLIKKVFKPEKKLIHTLSSSLPFNKYENLLDTKDQEHITNNQPKKVNSACFFIEGILQPLLGLISKIHLSYDSVYRPSTEMNYDLCWATLNFLKKYLELGKKFEEVGRYYYEEFSGMVIYIMCIIDFDLKTFYKNIVEYLKKSIEKVQNSIMKNKLNNITEEEQENIRNILLMVGQIETVNDGLRVLYLGKYFDGNLKKNNVKLPQLFRAGQIVDIFDQIIRTKNKQLNTSRRGKKQIALLHTEDSAEDKTEGLTKLIDNIGLQNKYSERKEQKGHEKDYFPQRTQLL